MSVRLEEECSYISFLRRNPRKLPKVEPTFCKGSQPRTKTGWLRWPFHRLEPLREERMKKARLKPIKDPDPAENHAEHGRVMEAGTEKRGRRGVVVPIVPYSNDTMNSEKVKKNEINDLKEVKRRPKQHSKCNYSIERNKRMSYPPCDIAGLHVFLERLQTSDHRNPPKIPVSEASLSQAYSTSCPVLYNPKCADRIPRSELNYRRPDRRRHTPSQHAKAHGDKTLHDHVKTSKHHQKGSVEYPSEQTNIHKNPVKQKLRKTKSYPNQERPRRPKPPSWQDQPPPPPSVTITEPSSNDAQSAAVAVEKEQSAAVGTLKEESTIAALGSETDARGLNRRSLLSRAHLKRTRSRVIDTREIPKEDHVIPLSRTQRHEFHLKETHHDNEIYLTENARRCRQWLADVEDLREENPEGSSVLRNSNDTVNFDLEVSNDRWNYLGSPYPSDSESDNV